MASARESQLLFWAAPLRACQEIRDSNQIVTVEPSQQPHVFAREVGSATIDCVVHLSQHIRIVLAGETWDRTGIVTLALRPVAARAALGIDGGAVLDKLTIAHVTRPLARHPADILRYCAVASERASKGRSAAETVATMTSKA
ncbi:MAG: hypothetical protein ABI885_00255 [Gammaproteobacteria bacterium]